VRLGPLALVATLVLAACGPASQRPRAVNPEADVCPECRMTVVPTGFAAESVDRDGQVLVFDDVGCLAVYVHDHAAAFVGAKFYVQDAGAPAGTQQVWGDLDRATLVRADDAPTPMNYDWHAFATPAAAQAFAAAHPGARVSEGQALDVLWNDVSPRRWQP
jgi:copper chaperone NosL